MKTGITCNVSRSKVNRPTGVLTEICTAGVSKTQKFLEGEKKNNSLVK
jgi:hypothetical protein